MKKTNASRAVAEAAHHDADHLRPLPLWHWFGDVPASVEPSRPIHYAGSALMLGIIAAIAADGGASLATHAAAGWPHNIGALWSDTIGSIAWGLSKISGGRMAAQGGADYADAIAYNGGVIRCITGATTAALGAAVGVIAFRWGARPQVPGLRHVRGPRLLEGREALDDARRYCIQRKQGDKAAWPLFALPLCAAERLWLPKDVWSKSALVYGSPGAGKTVVITPIVSTLIRWPKAKALIWDAKQDYSAAFLGRPGVAILSPCDARSVVWDLARDCETATDRAALAQVLASGGGSTGKEAQGDFFAQAATTVIDACLDVMHKKHGIAWGGDTFTELFSVDRATLLQTLLAAGHVEVDELIGTPDPKSSSIMATVGNAVGVVRALGRAWKFDASRPASQRFSVREWMRDDYDLKNRPRIIMVKPDETPDVVGRMLVAMTNILATGALQLPDNERGRCIAVVCDEIAALKSRIDIAALVATGRSKGIVAVLGLQDLHQLVPIYGPDTTKALASMVGLHIVGRTNMGETRQDISDYLGTRIVSVRKHGPDAGAATEDEQAVVMAPYLSHDLGPFGRVVEKDARGRKSTRAKGVRLLVHGVGPNVLRLEWPIEPLRKRAAGYVPAAWTTEPAAAPATKATAAPAAAAPAVMQLTDEPTDKKQQAAAAQQERDAIITRHASGTDMGWAS